MIKIVSIVLLVLFFIWLLLKLGSRPKKHKRTVADNLTEFFYMLLYSGYQGALLFIEVPNDNKFIQFVKYIKNERIWIETGFPLAEWSKNYYRLLESKLKEHCIKYSTINALAEGEQRLSGDTVEQYIIVNFGKDIEKAEQFSKIVLEEVFKLNSSDKIKLYLQNCDLHTRTTILGEEQNVNNIDDGK